MKRNDIQTIGDVLRLTVQQCDMTAKLDECRAAELWRPIVGDGLACRCGRPTVRGGVMTVPVPAAALRNELTMSRSIIRRLINEKLGKDVLKEIRFIS